MATVLVVDDDEMILRLFKDVVGMIGHEVVPMNSSELALESLVAGLRVDLLITDVVMPGMDGKEFVRRILKNPDDTQFPIIMISGEEVCEDLGEFLEHERVTFIQKPVQVGNLIATIDDRISSTINP